MTYKELRDFLDTGVGCSVLDQQIVFIENGEAFPLRLFDNGCGDTGFEYDHEEALDLFWNDEHVHDEFCNTKSCKVLAEINEAEVL